LLGDKPAKAPVATGLVTNRRLFRKLYYHTMPAVTYGPCGCSTVITTSYVRRSLRWTTSFSATIAKLSGVASPKILGDQNVWF